MVLGGRDTVLLSLKATGSHEQNALKGKSKNKEASGEGC